jgi:hypothetical protein
MPLHQIAIGPWHVDTWTLFGRASFVLCVLLLLMGGHRRGWPWRQNLLVTAAFAAGLSLGTALVPSVLGALAGGLLCWFLAQRVLGLIRPPLLALAIGVTALIAFGRGGCFLTGCCFGHPTDLPWGVHYGPGSFAFILHRELGLLASGASQSLAVHPYQLYESLGLALWLALLLRLGARLRSQGAALAATAAFDLLLRSWLDGKRAMLNVWWAATGQWFGVDRFRWALLAAGLACALVAWQLEQRARKSPQPEMLRNEPHPLHFWAVYASLWLIAALTRVGATPLLHWTLMGAMGIAALALPLPFAVVRTRAWLGPALGLLALLPIAVGHADTPQAAPLPQDPTRTWIYTPVPSAKALVRVGNAQDARDIIQQREWTLGVPLPPQPTPTERQTQVWVGGVGTFGGANYVTQTGCGGTSSVNTHSVVAGSGSAAVNLQIPVLEASWVHLGGRVGYVQDTDQVHSVSTTAATQTHGASHSTSDYAHTNGAGTATVWAEFESAYVSAGLSATTWPIDVHDNSTRWDVGFIPGGMVRLGLPQISVEVAVNDRQAMSPFVSARLGLSSTPDLAPRAKETELHLFAGLVTFPSIDGILRGSAGLGVDATYHHWIGGGLQCGFGEANFCGVGLRFNVLGSPSTR